VFLEEFEDAAQFLPGPDFPARVARCIDHEHLRFRVDRAFQGVEIDGPIESMRGYVTEGGSGEAYQVSVVAVEGFEQDGFVAGVQQGEDSGYKGSGRSDAHHHFRFRTRRKPIVGLRLVEYGLSEGFDPGVTGVDRMVRVDGGAGAFLDGLGRRQIANALAEVDAPNGIDHMGDCADVALDEAIGAPGKRLHGMVGHRVKSNRGKVKFMTFQPL
jgi:hypothetical protein